MLKISQYPQNADGTPMDLEVGVLTDATGNGGARLTTPPIGPDNAPIDAKAFILVNPDGTPFNASQTAASRTALSNASTLIGTSYLTESGREGTFVFSTANHLVDVSGDANHFGDTQQAIYIAPSTDTTGASGAWVRKFTGAKDARWFGAVGDGVTDDHTALQAWLDSGGDLFLPKLKFRSSAGLIVRRLVNISGIPMGNDSRALLGGSYENNPGSRIVFDAGLSGIGLDFQTSTTMTVASAVISAGSAAWTQEGAQYSSIKDVGLVGMVTGSMTGVYVRTIIRAENVRAAHFGGNGWEVAASTQGDGSDATYGNASNSQIIGCTAETCGGHGLYVHGVDANTILFANFNSYNCGGDGIRDTSFGLNTYLKPHIYNLGNAFYMPGSGANSIIAPWVEAGSWTNVGPNCVITNADATSLYGSATPVTISGARIRNKLIEAWGQNIPLTVNSTNSNGPKINIQNNGTTVSYLGSLTGIDFAVFNSDATAGFKLYSAANGRRVEVVGGLWGSTAAARLAVTTGMQAFYDTTNGGVFTGGGTSYDVTIQNKNGTNVAQVPTGTNCLALATNTVAALPATPPVGTRSFVTDANAATFGTAAVGGGTNKVPVYYDGAWKIG